MSVSRIAVRPPGRPRDETIAPAILAAARELVLRHGYDAVTTKMIADAVGAGKQTIYRRWPTKAELVLEAFADYASAEVDHRAKGRVRSIRNELSAFLRRTFTALAKTGPAVRSLMASAQSDVEFRRAFRERFIAPRRAALKGLLDEGVASEQLPAGADTEAATILAFGAMWYRLLLDEDLAPAFGDRLAAVIVDGLRRRR